MSEQIESFHFTPTSDLGIGFSARCSTTPRWCKGYKFYARIKAHFTSRLVLRPGVRPAGVQPAPGLYMVQSCSLLFC